jgi:hypothetical protein
MKMTLKMLALLFSLPLPAGPQVFPRVWWVIILWDLARSMNVGICTRKQGAKLGISFPYRHSWPCHHGSRRHVTTHQGDGID